LQGFLIFWTKFLAIRDYSRHRLENIQPQRRA
jgi:hypothetical protein